MTKNPAQRPGFIQSTGLERENLAAFADLIATQYSNIIV